MNSFPQEHASTELSKSLPELKIIAQCGWKKLCRFQFWDSHLGPRECQPSILPLSYILALHGSFLKNITISVLVAKGKNVSTLIVQLLTPNVCSGAFPLTRKISTLWYQVSYNWILTLQRAQIPELGFSPKKLPLLQVPSGSGGYLVIHASVQDGCVGGAEHDTPKYDALVCRILWRKRALKQGLCDLLLPYFLPQERPQKLEPSPPKPPISPSSIALAFFCGKAGYKSWALHRTLIAGVLPTPGRTFWQAKEILAARPCWVCVLV